MNGTPKLQTNVPVKNISLQGTYSVQHYASKIY